MNKIVICLAASGLLLAMQALHARDNAGLWPRQDRQLRESRSQVQGPAMVFGHLLLRDTARQAGDSSIHIQDSTIRVSDSTIRVGDSTLKTSDSVGHVSDSLPKKTDAGVKTQDNATRTIDTSNKVNEVITISADDGAAKTTDGSAGGSVASAKITDPMITAQDSTGKTQNASGKTEDASGRATDSTGRATDSTGKRTDTPVKTMDTPVKTMDTPGKTADSTGKTTDASALAAINPTDSTKQAQDNSKQAQDNTRQAADNAKQAGDSTKEAQDNSKRAQDTTSTEGATGGKRELDTRWFISPLLKTQFQDFSMVEQSRKGSLSNAYTLPFFSRGNGSIAASAYKNLTSRLSVSADIGLSFGHVTNNNVLISQTQSKTYNLLNATIYYHLLAPSYRLQPYLTVGINDLINDASYASAPVGIGAKYNGKKIMVLGQITYGLAVNSNIANTTMYSVGIYIPLKNKKKKQLEADDTSPYNRPGKDDDKKKAKDSTAKNGQIVNNIYITINMDSVLKARGYGNDDDGGTSGRRRKKGGGGGSDGDDDAADRTAFKDFNLDDFNSTDFKIDHIDGHPVIRFVVYFEFNEYSLTSKAFSSIDKVLDHLKHTTNMYIEIKGYTDDVGTDQYNNFLSRRRANMVRDYINSRGVPTDLMKAKAYGSDNPVADNGNPNTAWLNRRAEIIVRLK